MISNCLSLCLIGILVCFFGGNAVIAREAIVGGITVERVDEYPYQVSVQDRKKHHMCGGGLLNHKFVLTAANCIISQHNNSFYPAHIYVLTRTIDLYQNKSPAVYADVYRITVPNTYKKDGYVADIAVLELAEVLNTPRIAYSWLYWETEESYRSSAIIAGYGYNRVDRGGITGTTDGHLRYAYLRLLNDDACERSYAPGIVNAERHICARMDFTRHVYHFGVSTGDIGGPLVVHVPHPIVIGVLIRKSPNCDELDHRGYPGIYTRVSRYHDFIRNVVDGVHRTDTLTHLVPN